MEVHHHPDLHLKQKKWKEYFLEFLMIFLAVTLGFIAENIRENYVEHKSAREYAKPTGEGTGLGLSLSYDIIKAQGGTLKVESTEGEGSEFIIMMPADLAVG